MRKTSMGNPNLDGHPKQPRLIRMRSRSARQRKVLSIGTGKPGAVSLNTRRFGGTKALRGPRLGELGNGLLKVDFRSGATEGQLERKRARGTTTRSTTTGLVRHVGQQVWKCSSRKTDASKSFRIIIHVYSERQIDADKIWTIYQK